MKIPASNVCIYEGKAELGKGGGQHVKVLVLLPKGLLLPKGDSLGFKVTLNDSVDLVRYDFDGFYFELSEYVSLDSGQSEVVFYDQEPDAPVAIYNDKVFLEMLKEAEGVFGEGLKGQAKESLKKRVLSSLAEDSICNIFTPYLIDNNEEPAGFNSSRLKLSGYPDMIRRMSYKIKETAA